MRILNTPLLLLSAFAALTLTGCGPQTVRQAFLEEGNEVAKAVSTFLADHHPEARVVVLTRPGLSNHPLTNAEHAILNGLKKTYGSELTITELQPSHEQLAEIEEMAKQSGFPPEDIGVYRDSRLQSISTWFQTENLREILLDHGERADLVISLVGLPDDLDPDLLPDRPGLGALNTTVEQALLLLEHQKGWLFQAVRPSDGMPESSGVDFSEVGQHSLLLSPADAS